MKTVIKLILIIFSFQLTAQIVVSPDGSDGNGYPSITNAGLDYESPDCVHESFGPHITQKYDERLERNVFEFHSHIDDDNDRCQVFDRVRMEIKGGPGTNEESQHTLGSESYYRWKFKIPTDFKGSSSFCHIFQNKIKGGDDSSFPVITITPRSERLEVLHNGGDTGEDLGRLVEEDLQLFLGKWIEVYIYQLYSDNGIFHITMKDLLTGDLIIDYRNENIDLWRTGADYSRPKWGIYRRKAVGLKDEIIDLADFCISETSEQLCPADTIQFIDTDPPSAPSELTADLIQINQVNLSWTASEDEFGVVGYVVYQDDDSIAWVEDPEFQVNDLLGGQEYTFHIIAIDAAENRSDKSNLLSVITDDQNTLPSEPTYLFPTDMSMDVAPDVTLKWENGKNTDSSIVYFGVLGALEIISRQVESSMALELENGETYSWQIGQKNPNGITLGPIWTFTTTSSGQNGSWLVYEGNERPDLEVGFLEPRDIPDDPDIDEVMTDPLVPDNNIYQYFEESEEKFRWRYEFPESDTAITVVARIKAFPEGKNVGYFEIRQQGVRDKLRINHSTFKLEKSTPVVEEPYDFDFDAAFHIVRVTMQKGVMKVFLDENPVAHAIGFSETADPGSNFEFGKSGGTPTGSFVDWLIIHPGIAIEPGDQPSIPEGLILSNDANLQSIMINGEELEDFQADKISYTVATDNTIQPDVEASAASELAEVEISTEENEDGFLTKILVTAQDGYTEKLYSINFAPSSGISEATAEELIFRPNPSSGIVYLTNVSAESSTIKVLNTLGQTLWSVSGSQIERVDLSHLDAGLYYITIKSPSNNKLMTGTLIIK